MILPIHCIHYNDVIIRGIASQINGVWIFAQPFVHTQIKENIKAPRHWPLWRKLTVTGGFPSQMANNAENVSIWCFVCLFQMIDSCQSSTCNHVTLYGLASPRLLHSLIDHIKTSHSFKHGYSNGRWVVLYALVSPQWSHAWFRGRVRTILLPAAKLYPCVNKLGGSM